MSAKTTAAPHSEALKTPKEIITSVFKRWEEEEIPAWGDGRHTPSPDQFAEMAVEAIMLDRAQRKM